MNAQKQRARILLAQARFDLAERELRGSLAQDPEDWLAHAMLSFSLLRQDKIEDAVAEARSAIGCQPGAPYAHYVLALALYGSKSPKERAGARDAALQALTLDPEDPDHHSLLGWMDLDERRWQEALENAEKGLSLDPEHVQSANVRAQALVKLGRGAEAGRTLDTALARAPEDAVTHANMGWTLLESGDHRKAQEHFRESLRLDPNSEWAREGIVEAMKARNILYRGMLKYFFLMSRLQTRARWALILGAVFGVRILRTVARDNPGLQPVATAVSVLYLIFMAATWLSRPLFDLVLRLDSFGRLCLSEDQIKGSNLLGLTLAAAAGFAIAGFATDNGLFLAAGLGCLGLCLPVSAIYRVKGPSRRRVHAGIAVALAACGLGALFLPGDQEALGMIFIFGIMGYTWFANFFR